MAINFLNVTNTLPEIQINDTDNNPKLTFKESGVVSGGVSTTGGDLVLEASSGIERARILSTGNFGIGTATPTAKLQVAGSGNESVEIKVSGGTTAGNTGTISLSRTDGAGSIIQGAAFLAGGVPIGGIAGGIVGSSNTGAPAFAIQTPNSTNGHIVFKPKGTERMRIDSSGNVGIGEINVDARLHVTALASSGISNIKLESPGASKWAFGIPAGQTYFALDDTNDNLSTPKLVVLKTSGT